jgi:putative addiction module antidote
MKLELKKIGNSTGLILPKDLLARLGLQQGDSVFLTEGPDKTLTIETRQSFEGDDDETMRIAREVMKEYRSTLAARAK